MSDLKCNNCNRSHAGGLSCFYGISRINRTPVSKSNPSSKHSSSRKLLKNKYRRIKDNWTSFKNFVRYNEASQ